MKRILPLLLLATAALGQGCLEMQKTPESPPLANNPSAAPAAAPPRLICEKDVNPDKPEDAVQAVQRELAQQERE